jgi:hypothetical protein
MSTKKKVQPSSGYKLNVERGGAIKPKFTQEHAEGLRIITNDIVANQRYVQRVARWQALENFNELRATKVDWGVLQYWLYFTEDLISIFGFEDSETRVELAHRIDDARIEALYVAGRNYKASGYTFMYMTEEERELIRDALLICDELFDLVADLYNNMSDIIYDRIDMHVRKVLSIPEGQ